MGVGSHKQGHRLTLSLALILIIAVTVSAAQGDVSQNPFLEIPMDHWAYRALRGLADIDLVEPYLEISGQPDGGLTRFEMAVLTGRAVEALDQLVRTRGVSGTRVIVTADDVLAHYRLRADASVEAVSTDHLKDLARLAWFLQPELETLGYRVGVAAWQETTDATVVSNPSFDIDGLVSEAKDGSFTGNLRTFGAEGEGGWSGMETRLQLGKLDSTVILGERKGFRRDNARISVVRESNTLSALDGMVQVSDQATLEAKVVKTTVNDGGENGTPDNFGDTVASLEGRFQLSPAVTLSGTLAQRQADKVAGAFRLGATAQVGVVELGAKYRTLGEGYRPPMADTDPEEAPRSGYGFSVAIGDTIITADHDRVAEITADAQGQKTITALGVTYGMSPATVLRLGYSNVKEETASLDELRSISRARANRASVGLDVTIPKGRLRVEYAYEQRANMDPVTVTSGEGTVKTATASVEYRLRDALARADISLVDQNDLSKTTTGLGIEYALGREASLLLGLQLIDYSDLSGGNGQNPAHNVATAELSIKF